MVQALDHHPVVAAIDEMSDCPQNRSNKEGGGGLGMSMSRLEFVNNTGFNEGGAGGGGRRLISVHRLGFYEYGGYE